MRTSTDKSLDRRIRFVTLAVATLVMVLFAIVIAYFSIRMEVSVLDQMVIKEYGDIQRRLALDPEASLPDTAQLRVWLTDTPRDKSLPKELRKLPSGIFHEVRVGRSLYHVMREPMDQHFMTLALQIDQVEGWEQKLKIVLLASVIFGPGLIYLLSNMFTRRLTQPVMQLSVKLSTLDPSKRNVRLADTFHGQEVEAIAQAFDRYQERLDLLVEREQSFAAAASHELRTPLAVIGASAELLDSSENLPDDARKQVKRITNAVSIMGDLVNSLLFLSREHRQKPASPLHLQPIIEEAVANFRGQLNGRPVTIDFQCDPELTMWLSTGDVLIVLGNLLQNAVRNTEQGAITVICDKQRLSVSDTGRGMPREFAAHIFDRHVQAQDSHGVGLGLHIVKRLCDRYGWKIEVRSALGQGTTVTVYWSSVE